MHGRKQCFELHTNNNSNNSTQSSIIFLDLTIPLSITSSPLLHIITKSYVAFHETAYEAAGVYQFT